MLLLAPLPARAVKGGLTTKMKSDVQRAYDLAAEAYADRLFGELAHKPFDRAMLDRIVEKVGATEKICDMGCGPGQIARYLKDRGADASGIDLSSGMIENARRLNPDIEFIQGDMRALESVTEATFAGIVAAYAIVNIPRDQLPLVFREFRRILIPDGTLLLSFHVGHENEVRRVTDLFGAAVELDFFFYSPATVKDLLADAGFVLDDAIERDPYPEVEAQTRRCYLLAHRIS
jgi:ubiquinone/menaquinone biosynthesis C-methylase UbiE